MSSCAEEEIKLSLWGNSLHRKRFRGDSDSFIVTGNETPLRCAIAIAQIKSVLPLNFYTNFELKLCFHEYS